MVKQVICYDAKEMKGRKLDENYFALADGLFKNMHRGKKQSYETHDKGIKRKKYDSL